MTPWEWKIFSDKERFDMYTTSKNIVEESNKRIVEYEKQEAKDDQQIKVLKDKLEATRKEIKLLEDGKKAELLKVLADHQTKAKDAKIAD